MKIPIYSSKMRMAMLSVSSAAVSNGKTNYNAGGGTTFNSKDILWMYPKVEKEQRT
jgi:hypothetical protein